MNFAPPFLELLFLASIGISIHSVMKLMDIRKKKQEFDAVMFFSGIVVSFLISVLLIYTRESFSEIYPMKPITAGITGYASQSIFKNVMDMVQKNKTNE